MERPHRISPRGYLLAVLLLMLSASCLCADETAAPASPEKGLQQRIDFGNAHILGQRIKSGAVYLMHRKKSDIKNMLEVRQDYREEIIEDFDLDQAAFVKNRSESEVVEAGPAVAAKERKEASKAAP